MIYQAQPFMLESHLRSDLRRIGAATWIPIVVNGPAKGKASKKATAKKAGKKKKGNQGTVDAKIASETKS